MFTSKGGTISNDPREIPSIFLNAPVIIGILSLIGWGLLKFFDLHIIILKFVGLGLTLTITLRAVALILWIVSIYNTVHIIFCVFYMLKNDIFKTHQPWKYLILPKWYNLF